MGAMMLKTPQSIGCPQKLWGFVRWGGGLKFENKRLISSSFKDFGEEMSLMGNKVFQDILNLFLRF